MSGSNQLVGISVAAALALGAAFAPGCYPNPDDLRGGSGAPGCAEFASSWCANLDRCQPLNYAYTYAGNAARCQQRMSGYCTSILTGESDTGWTPAVLTTCADSWKTLSCADWINDPSILPGPTCRPPGNRPAGATCGRDLQCASTRCVFNATDACGQCGPRGGAGEACEVGTDCMPGFGCSDNSLCVTWGGIGDPCGADRRCLGTLTCKSGICALTSGLRGACTAGVDCDPSQELLCNFTTNQCGQATAAPMCDYEQADGKARYCQGAGRCHSDGTCTPAAAEGQSCSDTGAPCVFPAFCSSTGVCRLPTPTTCGANGNGNDGGAVPDGGGGGPPTLDAASAAFARAACARFQACAPRRLTGAYGTQASCEVRIKLNLDIAVALPDTGFTAATLSSCAAATAAQSCVDFDDGKIPAACDLPGKRANSQPCRSEDQCASAHCTAGAGTCGQCAARGGAGATCVRDGDCLRTLICATNGTGGGQCVSPGGLGASCTAATPCRYSLSCRAGICSTPGAGGVACQAHLDCDDRNGWLCNFTTGKCGAAVPASMCSSSATDGTVQYCASDGFCSAGGACIPAAGDGQSCPADGAQCVFPAVCIGGVCLLPTTADCP